MWFEQNAALKCNHNFKPTVLKESDFTLLLFFFPDGQDVVHGNQIMAWSMDADPLLYQMDYKDGSLVIQKDGFYYIYSKVSFLDTGVFHHSVHTKTERYPGKSIPLLSSRKYSEASQKMRQSNSYLGGVFPLNKYDTLFVKVSNTSKILRHKSFEIIFGAFMI